MASMLSLGLSVLISTERRRLVQVVPDSVNELWDKWNLRVSVLVSLVCQLILLAFGKSRKRSSTFGSLVWAAYLASDWVANFALGVMFTKIGDPARSSGEFENDKVLLAFWGTFLFVHLGGPPTITAQTLEDNALWLRSLILWIVQTIRVIYIVQTCWRGTRLSYASLGLLVIGFVKCGERTWALYSASIDNRPQLYPPSDPSINYMNESDNSSSEEVNKLETKDEVNESETEDEVNKPRVMFKKFKLLFMCLFVDHVLSPEDLRREQSSFRQLTSKRAFELVEVQLAYAFDALYTKAYIMFSPFGILLGHFSMFITQEVVYYFSTSRTKEMHGLPKIDIFITWALMIGHYIQEIYTMFEFVYSYWTREARDVSHFSPLYGRVFECFNQEHSQVIRKCNLLRSSLRYKGEYEDFEDDFEILVDTDRCEIDENLTENIFKHFINKSKLAMERLCSIQCGVHAAIEAWNLKSLEWIKMLEFHQSILAWHIATDLCYYGTDGKIEGHVKSNERISSTLSEYMMYLLVKQRHMLPIGRGAITFSDTIAETMKFFYQSKLKISVKAYKKLLQVNQDSMRRGRSNSVLLDACRLARSLINEMEIEQRWEFLAAVWMEILGYAATHCRVDQHAQQLRKGGEFLTHVWLLMAQLGVMEQFQVTPTPGDPPEEQTMGNVNEFVNESRYTDENARRPDDGIGEREIEEHIP